MKDMPESYGGEFSLRTTFAKHVPSFTPVAQHYFFLLYTTMERNIPW